MAVSFAEELQIELNIVPSLVNIPTSDLLVEGRSLKKQLNVVEPRR